MANAELSTSDDIAENGAVPQEGFNVILARVFSSYMLLKLANFPYRYRHFMYHGENQKARLQISPEPEREPPPLPEWLQIPYLVPVKGYSFRIIYDSCANPITRSGDGSYDQAKRIVGTLGAVMSSSRPALTAGHVIPALGVALLAPSSP
jgi:hypothetical protein